MKIIATTLLALALALGVTVQAAEDTAKTEAVSVDQLPAAVKTTFEAEEKSAQIKDISKITDGTKVKYRIHYSAEGKTHQITILEDGTLAAKRHTDGDKKGDAAK
jgi:hypothetical protein